MALCLFLAPAWAYADSHGGGLQESLSGLALGIAHRPWGVVLATLGYAAAGVLFVPVNLLAVVALAVFGAWPGMGVAWVGGLLGATISHALGWSLGPRALGWIPQRFHQRLLALSRHQVFWAVVLMRILPVGNFGAFNLLAGAFKLPRLAYVLGNMMGLVPGLLGWGAIGNRLAAVLRQPSLVNDLLLGLALVLAVAAVWALRRLARCLKKTCAGRPVEPPSGDPTNRPGCPRTSPDGSHPANP